MDLLFNILDVAALVFIGLAILGVLFILIRKFRLVSAIDTKSIPKHQQEEVRQQLAAQRLQRKFEKASGFVGKAVKPFFGKVFTWMRSSIQRLIQIERKISVSLAKKESKIKEKAEVKLTELKERAEEAHEEEDYVEAEQKYIEMISLDPQSVEAYKKLGDLYMDTKDYRGALETYGFIINLEKKRGEGSQGATGTGSAIADHYADVARAHIGLEEWPKGLTNVEEALKYEPNNPKYLDLLLTISLELKDVSKASDALTRLKEVNPENQKLEEFTDQLAHLEK